eukprot:TRINITY_DN9603_c0_g2_i2.p1 TRINITY_DN9603_c0_g2~~TRINITY_DN9603_c0_g2_i2.p1  ORF type:complete len:235 (-),score=28.73 TRINITY_DN9603_c0_g2_i2:60-719(-)
MSGAYGFQLSASCQRSAANSTLCLLRNKSAPRQVIVSTIINAPQVCPQEVELIDFNSTLIASTDPSFKTALRANQNLTVGSTINFRLSLNGTRPFVRPLQGTALDDITVYFHAFSKKLMQNGVVTAEGKNLGLQVRNSWPEANQAEFSFRVNQTALTGNQKPPLLISSGPALTVEATGHAIISDLGVSPLRGSRSGFKPQTVSTTLDINFGELDEDIPF